KEMAVSPAKQLKFSLTDKEILTLSRWAILIEELYSKKFKKWMPQDIEWAKDGKTGELFIVQSRPETVHASKTAKTLEKSFRIQEIRPYKILPKVQKAIQEKVEEKVNLFGSKNCRYST
ncbi:unnamed protein product, partial [marine sediment metagenome]